MRLGARQNGFGKARSVAGLGRAARLEISFFKLPAGKCREGGVALVWGRAWPITANQFICPRLPRQIFSCSMRRGLPTCAVRYAIDRGLVDSCTVLRIRFCGPVSMSPTPSRRVQKGANFVKVVFCVSFRACTAGQPLQGCGCDARQTGIRACSVGGQGGPRALVQGVPFAARLPCMTLGHDEMGLRGRTSQAPPLFGRTSIASFKVHHGHLRSGLI